MQDDKYGMHFTAVEWMNIEKTFRHYIKILSNLGLYVYADDAQIILDKIVDFRDQLKIK